MDPVSKILKSFPCIVLDGALATELERRGCEINDALWSAKILAEDPELIQKVHYDYFVSGADCAITASYQATIQGFIRKGFSVEESEALIRRAVIVAKKARDDFWKDESNRMNRPKPFVAGSIGSYGAYLADGSEYRGDYRISEDELIEFHRPRIRLLLEEGVDLLACETIPSLKEARAIVKLFEEFPEASCWVSFSAKNGYEISDGTPILECAGYLETCRQVAAIGVNCTPPGYMKSLISEIRKNSKKPVVVYPNSGEEYDARTKTWHGSSGGGSFGCCAEDWFKAGARLIGGCCRTRPEDIRAIASWARNKP